MLKISGTERVSDQFHQSGMAQNCPPDASAHISAHNAVKLIDKERSNLHSAIRARHRRQLDDNYQKAQQRAGKKGRQLPPQKEYYNHWGYQYYSK